MTIPKPTGLTARHDPGWGYITVPAKRGYAQELEYQDQGDWTPASRAGTEWLVPIPQRLRVKWQARYTRSGETSPWATGTIWQDGFEEDAGGPKPERPHGLQASKIGGEFIAVDWAAPAVTPDAWKFAWRREGQRHWNDRTVNSGQVKISGGRRHYAIRDLARYTSYEVTVRAVIGGVESDPAQISVLTTGRVDELPGPADPHNATADAIGDTSVTISWDQDDPRAVRRWQVSVGQGPMDDVTDQEHTFTGLTPDTRYTASVFAVGHDGSYARKPAEVEFTTSGDQPDPTPQPPTGLLIAGTDPAAGTATVGWNVAGDADFWRIVLDDAGTTPRIARRNQFVFRGLQPGREYGWRVRAVATDDEGTEFESPWTRGPAITLDTTPPPRPEPPTGLHVHCIADVSAKVEWDNHPTVDAWEVWVDDDREHGAVATVTPLVRVKDLLPGTRYTAHVVAVVGEPGQPGYAESQPVSIEFETLETILPPDPTPPPDIGADLPAPSGLLVRAVNSAVIEAVWRDDRPSVGQSFYLASVDRVHWDRVDAATVRFTDLKPGAHTVHVYGVFGAKLTGIARAAATLKEAQPA